MKTLTRFSFALLILSLSLSAQVNTGAVSGYLLDPSSKAIPNAPVSIEDTAKSFTRSGRTNPSGFYEFDGLPPAEYRVSANADSFTPLQTEPIRVEVDQRLRLDLHATIAVKGERVVVQAAT